MRIVHGCAIPLLILLQIIVTTSASAAPLKILLCSDHIAGPSSPAGSLQKVDIDGTNLVTMRTNETGSDIPIRGCSYDSLTDRVFFSEGSDLKSTTIAGSVFTTLQSPGGTRGGIAIDSANSKMYWSDSDNDAIKFSSNTTASATIETLVTSTSFATTRDIEIDSVNSLLYAVSFSSDTSAWSIRKISLDGATTSIVVTGLNSPIGVGVDAANNRLFYTDAGTSKIWKVDLDGSNQVDLTATVGGVTNPQDIDYDAESGKIYWLDNGTSIKRSNPDGSSVEAVVTGIDRVVYFAFYTPDLVTLPPTLTNPQAGNAYITNLPITFTLGKSGLSGSTSLTFR